MLGSAALEYAQKAKVREPEIIVDNVHLPPGPSDNNPHGPFW